MNDIARSTLDPRGRHTVEPVPATMRAAVRERYGQHDALSVRDVAVPTPAVGEVLVRVHASSVNFADHAYLTGRPWPLRFVSGLWRPKQAVIGSDFSGVVAVVGPGVTRWSPGDAVFGQHLATWADFACVPADRMAPMPASATFEEAATLPLAGVTALQGMRDKARVKPGARVLVNGASGSVGTFAVQVARALGAEVTAVCSPRNVEQAFALGASRVVDYTREDFTATSERYDAVFDLAGSRPLRACLAILEPDGAYVASCGRLGWVLKVGLASMSPGSRVTTFVSRQNAADLEALAELFDAGQIRAPIDRTYALEEIAEAMRGQGEGHARAKSVITVAQ